MAAEAQVTSQARVRSLPMIGVQWLVALAITVLGLALFLNGSLASSWGAPHIDLSINITAAHALRDGENPYGPHTLRERAIELGGPYEVIYSQLFTSYIQPPPSAISLLPLTTMEWRDATRVYLVFNHIVFLVAITITLMTIRPTLPLPWVIAGASLIVGLYSQTAMSFSLGQVDPTLLLMFSVAFWAYTREKPVVAGIALAYATAIKLVPGMLLLYFLWKRQYRIVAWGAGAGLVMFLASLAYVGTDTYRFYIDETLPALSKGSTQYSNASLGAINARSVSPPVINNILELYYLDEVPDHWQVRYGSMALLATGIAVLATVIPRQGPGAGDPGAREARSPLRSFVIQTDTDAGAPASGRPSHARTGALFEYYLVIAVTLLISSVTWEFYTIWLLPVFFAAFLAPSRFLPAGPARYGIWAVLVAVLLLFNYPGDFYLFGSNPTFFHPEWVPGQWVEDKLRIYHLHLDIVVFIRLAGLSLLVMTLSGLIVWRRAWPAARSA